MPDAQGGDNEQCLMIPNYQRSSQGRGTVLCSTGIVNRKAVNMAPDRIDQNVYEGKLSSPANDFGS